MVLLNVGTYFHHFQGQWARSLYPVPLFSVPQAVENKLYNDSAAVYYMLLESYSKNNLPGPGRRPSLPTAFTPKIVIDNVPSGSTGNSTAGMEEMRHSQVESLDGGCMDPYISSYLQTRRHTIQTQITPDELSNLQFLAERQQQSSQNGVEMESVDSNSSSSFMGDKTWGHTLPQHIHKPGIPSELPSQHD